MLSCNICKCFTSSMKYVIERHLVEQHSGFGYRCPECNKVFIRGNQKHQQCVNGQFPKGMLVFNRLTGTTGEEAERELKDFKAKLDGKFSVSSQANETTAFNKIPKCKKFSDNGKRKSNNETVTTNSKVRKTSQSSSVAVVSKETNDKFQKPVSSHKKGATIEVVAEAVPVLVSPTAETAQGPFDGISVLSNTQGGFSSGSSSSSSSSSSSTSSSSSSSSSRSGRENSVNSLPKSINAASHDKAKSPSESDRRSVVNAKGAVVPSVNSIAGSRGSPVPVAADPARLLTFITSDSTPHIQDLQETQEEKVILNVGGSKFETSRVTLAKDPSCLLARMVDKSAGVRPTMEHGQDMYFVDRDPAHFRHILNHLRNGGSTCISTLPRERRFLEEVKRESQFFWITGLEALVTKRLEQLAEE